MEGEEFFTRKEVIEFITERVNDKLWCSDEKLILETAELVGIDFISHYCDCGLFVKKTSSTT